MTMLILKRYWKPLTLLLIIILSVVAVWWYGLAQYNAGASDATATLQDKFDKLNAEQVRRTQQASADYQALKTKLDNEKDIKYVEIEKIIREPVYLNDCIDTDGLSSLNEAISGG